ncbi:CLUMA_CG011917, isoform A [Clunio marinus]|uniref:WD repeat-containing protein 79 n=1 Tax=Clunio marinus TaxID=568069 RepID=A0A1J1IIB4_9DIPT|nr:CLUMA_CG011917, isoform A [Clunio marinus]
MDCDEHEDPSDDKQIDKQLEENIQESKEESSQQKNENEASNLLEKEKHYFKEQKVIEVAKATFPNTSNQHYTKGVLFSPDGTCILSTINANGMLCYELPQDLYGKEEINDDREITLFKPVISIKSVGNIYDFCWYPFMSSYDAETCFWISSAQNEPIKMFDAFNGSFRCSYRAYDYADELEAALSLCFSPDGTCIYGGYKKSIKVFTTSVPGRDYDTINTKQPISCLAMNYYESNVLAAGSWNKTISLIDTRDYLTIDTLHGHKGGVTYLKYSSNGENLISGSRKDSNLLLWDMRNLSLPLYKFMRKVENNQKVYFDISTGGTWLASGDTRGIVHIWNLRDLNDDGFPKEIQFPLHQDSCSGVNIHPYLPILATSSGQFKFNNDGEENEFDEQEIIENSLVLWWFGNHIETSKSDAVLPLT